MFLALGRVSKKFIPLESPSHLQSGMEETQSKISLFEYMDVHLFLQNYYKIQKTINARFSYTKWAEQLGLTNKTILRMMLQKKRSISPKSVSAFQINLNLNEFEKSYFETLVHYSQAKNSLQKQAYGSVLIKIQRQNFNQQIFSADGGILFDVYGPLVLTIINSVEKPISVYEIQQHCGLEDSKLTALLDRLTEAKMISCDSNLYFSSYSTFKIPDQFAHPDLKAFYKYWFKKASEAINLPFEVRRFRSLQIALTQDEFDEVVQHTNEFATGLLSKVQNHSMDDRKLYLLNTALFPIK